LIGGALLVAGGFVGILFLQRSAGQQAAAKKQAGSSSDFFTPQRDISTTDASQEFSDVNRLKPDTQSAGVSQNPALDKFKHDFPFATPPDYLLKSGSGNGATAPGNTGQAGAGAQQGGQGGGQGGGSSLFSRSFFPNANANGSGQVNSNGGGEHHESDAEMYRRLEREARLAPTRVDLLKKADGAAAVSSAPATGAGYQQSSSASPLTLTSPAASAGSELRELGEIAKGLVAAQAGSLPQGSGSATAPNHSAPTGDGMTAQSSSPDSSSSPANAVIKRMQQDTMAAWRTGPTSPYEIKAGDTIPCALKQEMDTEAPGMVECQVTHNVKDSRKGMYVLIPDGSRMIGSYKPAAYGNEGASRVEALFTRILFPDTSSMDLEAIAAQDNKGAGGIRGKANNHYKAIISATMLQALVASGEALLLNRSGGAAGGGIGYYPSASQAAESGAANSVMETGSQLTRRAIHIPVTIHVNAGAVIGFQLDRDLQFDGPYHDRKPLMPVGGVQQ
jgi:type IV secretory pathway VirB10-like protein